MKHRFLPASLAVLFFSACASRPTSQDGALHEPGAPRTSADFIGPLDGSRISGLPASPKRAADNVTAGLRSGSGAIDRNNIDALLNNPRRRAGSAPKVRPAEERPGLATGYGPAVSSPWFRQSFTRATSAPVGSDTVYYNDREGIEAMNGDRWKINGARRAAGDMLEWRVKGFVGYLPAYSGYYGRSFVVGQKGGNYSIVLKNRCRSRLEVVLSVDGLDVIDGKTASTSKRGYMIGCGETLEVKGWRTSMDSVARFQFSTVAGSYANLAHGETRNIGVIGLVVYTEKGVDPWKWMPDEVEVRQTANPFTKAP